MPPMRPLVEQRPIMLLRISVGNSSAVNEYTMAKTSEIKNFPIKEKTIRITGGSMKKIKFI